MNIISDTLRSLGLIRVLGHALGFLAVAGMTIAQGWGVGHWANLLWLPALVGVDSLWSFFDIQTRRIRNLPPDSFPFKSMRDSDREFLQSYFLRRPGAQAIRSGLVWLIVVGVVFAWTRWSGREDSFAAEVVAILLGLGLPVAGLFQVLLSRAALKRIIVFFHYSNGPQKELARWQTDLATQRWRQGACLIFVVSIAPAWLAMLGTGTGPLAWAWLLIVGLAFARGMASLEGNFVIEPLRDLQMSIRRASDNEMGEPVDVVSGDEIGLVTQTWNLALKTWEEQLERYQKMGQLYPENVSVGLDDSILNKKGEEREIAVVRVELLGLEEGFNSGQIDAPSAVKLQRKFMTAVITKVDAAGGCMAQRDTDSLTAVFGAPVNLVRPAVQALGCAWDLRQALETWCNVQKIQGGAPMKFAIAAAWGKAAAGRLGPEMRSVYGFMGGPVSKAADLIKETPGELLICDSEIKAALEVPLPFTFERLGDNTLRVTGGPQAPEPAENGNILGFKPGERLS